MGVAVMSSMWGAVAFAEHLGPLHHSEAVLLVHNGHAEVLEFDALLDDRVRADRHLRTALGKIRKNLFAERLSLPADEQVGRDAEGFEVLLEVAVVLLGQDLGRGHEGALEAVVERVHHRRNRHHRLPTPDVPLDEPAHLHAALRIANDVLQSPFLRAGEREGKHFVQKAPVVVAGIAEDAPRHLLPRLPRKHEEKLDKQKLLELEPLARLPKLGLALGEVDGSPRHAPVDEAVFFLHPRGQDVRDVEAVLLEEAVDDAAERPAREADFFERGAAGVEGDDAARIERGPFFAELVEVGVGERELTSELLRLAVESDAVAVLEQLLDPARAPEPDAFQLRPARVFDDQFEPALAAPPRHESERAHLADDRHRSHVFVEVADGRDGGAVEVAAGVVVEEVAERVHAGTGEGFGFAGSYPAQVRDVAIKDV